MKKGLSLLALLLTILILHQDFLFAVPAENQIDRQKLQAAPGYFFPSVTELQRFFRDSDQDGRGNAALDTLAETRPAGYVSDSSDCDDSNPNRFRKTPRPFISLVGGGTSFCAGETATIQVLLPDSTFTYLWSTGIEGLNLSTQVVDSAGPYFVAAAADSGCPAVSDSLILSEVTQLPVTAGISVSPSSTICTGTSVSFFPSITGGGSDPFYEWYVNDLFVETGSNFTTDSLKNGDQVQLILTTSTGCGNPVVALSSKITMAVEDSIRARAGTDTTVCGTDYVLQGNALGFWTVIGGGAVIQNPSSATTTVSGLAASGNQFVWTIAGGTCPESKDTLELASVEPTIADAGFDRILCASSSSLQGNGIPGEGAWSLISGNILLVDSLNPSTPFTDLAEGNTILEWKISATAFCPESRDTVILSREAVPSPALAGSDQSICDSSAQLAATEPLVGQGTWSVLSGGGVLSRADSSVSSISNLPEGITILLWSVSNGLCPARTDSLRLEVAFPRKASAGTDQILCDSSATLEGNNPVSGAGSWFILSGAGTLADSSLPNTLVNNLGIGENFLVWTLDNGACDSDQDTVKITRELSPGISLAGEDREVCGNALSLAANFPAVGTGQWNVLSGTAVVSDSLNPLAQLSGSENSVIRLEWQISNGTCVSSRDTVQISLYGPPSAPLAGPDQVACSSDAFLLAQSPQSGSGRWRVLSGSSLLADSLATGTAVSNLAEGLNSFEWKVQNGVCPPLYDTVSVSRFAGSISLGSDTLLCEGENFTLSLSGSYQNILWSDGSTGSSLLVNSPGLYFVQANGPGGCPLSDSILVTYTICTPVRPDQSAGPSCLIFPNPFEDQFGISLRAWAAGPVNYRIVSATGSEVCSGEFRAGTGNSFHPIKTGSLAPGLYILEIRSAILNERVRIQAR